MTLRRLTANARGENLRVGIVLSRFNPEIGELLLQGAARALQESGVKETAVTVVTVPGALESPLALQRMAQSGDYHALVALGAVIRGETYHFDLVANESAAGVASVQLEFGVPVANGILTTDTDEQAKERAAGKGRDAVLTALEMANLLIALDEAHRAR